MIDRQRLAHIRKLIRRDKRLSDLEDRFNNLPYYQINGKELHAEIKRIHMVRKTRQLNRKSKTFVGDITESLIDDQAHRSRLTEILMECVKIIRNLENTLESIEGHLLLEYSELLSEIRTKSERESFIHHNILKEYFKHIEKVERIKQVAEFVIVDIDKAGYMLKNLIEAVKLAAGRREAV